MVDLVGRTALQAFKRNDHCQDKVLKKDLKLMARTEEAAKIQNKSQKEKALQRIAENLNFTKQTTILTKTR